MSEVKCNSCHNVHSSADYVERCFVCGRDACFNCGQQKTVRATGRVVRVCSHCRSVPDDRLC